MPLCQFLHKKWIFSTIKCGGLCLEFGAWLGCGLANGKPGGWARVNSAVILREANLFRVYVSLEVSGCTFGLGIGCSFFFFVIRHSFTIEDLVSAPNLKLGCAVILRGCASDYK